MRRVIKEALFLRLETDLLYKYPDQSMSEARGMAAKFINAFEVEDISVEMVENIIEYEYKRLLSQVNEKEQNE